MRVALPLLPPSQLGDDELATRYHRDGDLGARRELVERFLPLARDLAFRYSYAREPLEDLVQVACVGLLKAIDRYEPDRGPRFASYAAPTILGELKRYFRDKGWAVHLPRRLQERVLRVNREIEVLSRRRGRSPRVSELAAALEWPTEDVLEALEAAGSSDAISLDTPARTLDAAGSTLLDFVGDEDKGYETVEDRAAIAQGWRELSETETKVIELRFGHDLSQREIGERIGCSQMHVSRLLRRALDRLETASS